MTYAEKLKDPRWQKKRLQILERDNWECQECAEKEKTLHVHHKNYYSGKDPWECNDNNLITLCETCHTKEGVWKISTNDLIHDLLIMGWDYHQIYHALEYSLFKDDGKKWNEYLSSDHGKKVYRYKQI